MKILEIINKRTKLPLNFTIGQIVWYILFIYIMIIQNITTVYAWTAFMIGCYLLAEEDNWGGESKIEVK